MPASDNDVRSELSYAYLHAIAARARCDCQISQRLSDNECIDARLTASGEFSPPPSLTIFDVYVQLKATSQELAVVRGRFSFRIKRREYDKLRVTRVGNQWILVLLILPATSDDWLKVTTRALTIKRCAYWVSLRGADPSPGDPDDKLTIHIPKRNRFTVDALQALLVKCSLEDWVTYEA